jgi:hypothetical protein
MKLPEGMPGMVPTKFVLQLVASMCMADNIGDAWNYMEDFLKKAKIKLDADHSNEDPYYDGLAKLGVRTLNGVLLDGDDDE